MCKRVSMLKNKKPQDLLKMSGQINKVPVDMKVLLEKLDISYKQYDFSQIEQEVASRLGHPSRRILGALVTNGDNALILCRKDDLEDSHRHRFTIAHELGHCCIAQQNATSPSSIHLRIEGDQNDREEIAANVFAGELLIPENELKKSINSLILPSIHSLANIFAVSDNVMKARLRYLKIKDQIAGYNY